jgi:DNA-binding GntR family transcriptional regulator
VVADSATARIVEAIARRDGRRAARLMTQHPVSVERNLQPPQHRP